jgi:hypothetical protein
MSGQLLQVSWALSQARTQHGFSLGELSLVTPVLIAFLDHFDSPICRETVVDISQIRTPLETEGARIALVHRGGESDAKEYLRGFGLDRLARVSDPDRWLHRAVCLRRGGPLEWLASRGWEQGLEALPPEPAPGVGIGDPQRMPGIFLVFKEQVVEEYRHKVTGNRSGPLWLAAHPVGSLS